MMNSTGDVSGPSGEPVAPEPDAGHEDDRRPKPVDRRTLIKGGAIAAGTAWTAPVIYGSFASPAAAATIPPNYLAVNQTTPGTGSVNVPPNRRVQFELIGGGGGGGAFWSYIGGTGTKVTGTIEKQSAGYTLNWQVGAGGGGGKCSKNGGAAGTAGAGYVPGGVGGTAGSTSASGCHLAGHR